MSTKRDDIIHTTSDLLERQGYFATGLNQIVDESGARYVSRLGDRRDGASRPGHTPKPGLSAHRP
jgi:hypothetical protein